MEKARRGYDHTEDEEERRVGERRKEEKEKTGNTLEIKSGAY